MALSSPELAPRRLIELRGVHVIYGGVCVLDIEDWGVDRRERVFLLGRSGSGKTTLMRVIKGRVKPTTGEARVLGHRAAANESPEGRAVQRRVAMIDQEFHLVPRMRVIDNVLTGALGHLPAWKTLFGSYPTIEWENAERILNEVGLDGLEHRRVETLSGGQRQRAAIARALMQEAEVILADEPVSALDPELAEDALDLLVECVERRGMTLVVSLHQPALAKRFATRLVGLAGGKIVYNGPPEGLTEDASDKVYRNTLPQDMMDAKGPIHDTTSKSVAEKATPSALRVLDR